MGHTGLWVYVLMTPNDCNGTGGNDYEYILYGVEGKVWDGMG